MEQKIKFNKSFSANRKGIFLMLLSALCVCFGQLFWKLSATGNIQFLILGFALYGIGAVIMVIAYKFGSLSVLQPMLSVNYILTLLIGKFLLNEEITLLKLIGIIVIIGGVILIGGGDE